ncbi:MAG: NAD-dependent epimerase/dehydratase family protein [Proteobacteria bacterium]|nr:NAD-dependent epimerase/dehydratase family protein [Pseudomonadota bacterium]
MKILITGATGFVGSAVTRRLIAAGHELRALVRSDSDRRNVLDLPVELAEGSLEDEGSLVRAARGCKGLFHIAADYRLWVPNPKQMYQTNVVGTGLLMEAALKAGVERIVYTSSVATLGYAPKGAVANEDTLVSEADMIGPYKHSKFLAEKLVSELALEKRLPVVIVNPSTPLGPRDLKPTPTGRLVIDAARKRMPAYVDTGLNIVHVDDVAEGHLLAFEKGVVGERYILGGDNLELSELLRLIAETAGFKPPRIKLPRKALFPIADLLEGIATLTGIEPMFTTDSLRMAEHKMFFSSAKAESELSYTHRPASKAVQDAYKWFKEAGYC